MTEAGLPQHEMPAMDQSHLVQAEKKPQTLIEDEVDPLACGDYIENPKLGNDHIWLDYDQSILPNQDSLFSKLKNIIPTSNIPNNKLYRQKIPTMFSTSNHGYETGNISKISTIPSQDPDISPYHSYDHYIYSYRDLKTSSNPLIQFFDHKTYTPSHGPHIFLLTLLTFPLAFAVAFIVSLYYSALSIYNFYEYYFGDRRHALYRLKTPLKITLLVILILLAAPVFAVLCGVFSGLYAAFNQITCNFYVWRREFLDPEKGFFGWVCTLLGLPHCCPYDITLARETRNIQRNAACNLPYNAVSKNKFGGAAKTSQHQSYANRISATTGNGLPTISATNQYYYPQNSDSHENFGPYNANQSENIKNAPNFPISSPARPTAPSLSPNSPVVNYDKAIINNNPLRYHDNYLAGVGVENDDKTSLNDESVSGLAGLITNNPNNFDNTNDKFGQRPQLEFTSTYTDNNDQSVLNNTALTNISSSDLKS